MNFQKTSYSMDEDCNFAFISEITNLLAQLIKYNKKV
jgi:hypothetical protein